MWLVVSFAIFFNTVLAKKLPIFEGIIVLFHLLGILIIVPLWVLSPRNNGHDALLQFTNDGGWATQGTSVMVGMLSTLLSLLGLDCSVHMGAFDSDHNCSIALPLTYRS